MKPNFTFRLLAIAAVILFPSFSIFSQQIETITLKNNQKRHLFSDFSEQEKLVEVCALLPGETYRVWAVQTDGCSPTARLADGGDPAAIFDFVADDDCVEMIFSKGDGTCIGELYLSLTCISKQEVKPGSLKAAAIAVAGGHGAQSLIEDIFIGGGCFDIENVTAIGPGDGKGVFFSGSTTIGIETGVILASGNVINALGPNNGEGTSSNLGGGGDVDLQQIATATVFDAVGIEFDFTPTIDSMTFEYAFASEEYCEYVNSAFNDVFGFFISGPGITGPFSGGGANIANLPNGGVVSINNVNHLTNTGYFVGNNGSCGTGPGPDIEYDGYTVPLTAKVYLQACETYHIRLVVGDAGDGIFDSAVFLKANSFVAGNAIQGQALSISTQSNQIYEACNDGFLYFYRIGGDINMPLVYDLELDPASTATPGLDYTTLPTQVVIPAGASFVQIPFDVFDDGIPEGVENVILSMESACSCEDAEIIIEILDSEPIELTLPPEEICVGEVFTLDPAPTGGLGIYNYQWSNGSTDPFIVVTPPVSPVYSVTVTDNCGAEASISTNITINQLPTANISGDPNAFLCEGDPNSFVNLNVNFTGAAPFTFVYTINGVVQPPVTTTDNPYVLQAYEPGAYELVTVASAAGCDGTAFGVAIVNSVNMTVDLEADPVTCILGGSLYAYPGGGIPNFTYQWSNPGLPNPNAPVQIDIPPGDYSVTVTDVNGCSAEDEVTVETIEPLEMSSSSTNVDCSSGSSGTIEIEATSGSTPINYNWSGGLPNQPNHTGLAAGTYYVTVFDDIGCTIIDTLTITSNSVPPEAVASTPGLLNCFNTSTDVSGNGSATGSNISYQWSGPGIVSGDDEINAVVNQSGTYTLVVTDNDNGCTSSADTEVDIDITPPSAVAAGNEISCTITQVNLDGTGSSTGANISYQWSGPGIVSGETSLIPTVNAAGTYTLIVTNTDNGCTEETTTEVTQDDDLPTAVVEDPIVLDCNINSLILDGSGSSSGAGITYQWYENGNALAGETSTSLSVSGPGNYQIVVSDSNNGCEANYAVDVQQDLAPPVVTAEAAGQLTCTQTSIGISANIADPSNYSFEWSTGTGSIVGATNGQNATAETPGIYEVLVTSNLNGCTALASVEVTQDASIPSVEIEPSDELNCVTSELQLDGTNSSQGPSLTYTWTTVGGNITGGQNTLTPTVNAAGTYILTINDSSNGCESENQIVIDDTSEDPDLVVANAPILNCDVTSLAFDATVSNFATSDLQILWTTANGSITGPNNILNAETSAPGTYTLIVTNVNNGCTDEATVIVDQDITPPVPIIGNPAQLTCTNNTVTLDAGFSSTGPNFIYEWTTVSGSIASGANTLNPVVNQDGDYILTITDNNNGCTASESVTVEQNANVPQVEAGSPADFTCDIVQMTLNGSGSTGAEFTYQWNGPSILNGGNSLTPLVNASGVYELIVTNTINQCTASDLVTLGEDYAEPTAEAGLGGQLSCSVTSMVLDGSGSSASDVTYLWTSPNGSIVNGQTTLNPEINAPGTYVIQVTSTLNGCTSTDEVIIEEDDDLPVVDIALAPPITCDVLEITLDGTGTQTGANFTYVWGTSGGGNILSGANSLEPIVNAPGTYALTVTNTATNCTNIGTVTVGEDTAPPAAEAGLGDELNCTEISAILNGGGSATGSNISYLWSTVDGNITNGASTLTPTIDDPGTYTILVTDANNGCTNTDQVIVTEDIDAPTAVAASFGQLTCAVNEIQVGSSGSSQGINFNYEWTTQDGNIVAGTNDAVVTVDQPGTYTLLVINTGNGCTSSDQAIVLQDTAEPTAEAGTSNNLTCDVETLDLDGTGSSAGADFSYLWTTADGEIVSGANTLNPTIGEVGTYLLTVTNSLNGCTSTDEVTVGQDQNTPSVSIAPPATLTCDLAEISLNGTISQGPDFEFIWSTANGNFVSGTETLVPVIDQPGTYTLFVTNSANGCTNELSILVSQNIEAPSAYAGLDFLLDCTGDNPSLSGLGSSGNGTLSYNWETNGGIIESGEDTAEPTISQAGTYILTITDSSNGCTDTDEITVSTTGPVAAPESLQPGCFGELGAIVVANVNGGVSPYLYSIDGGNTFTEDAIHTNLDPGTYDIVVQDAAGCEYVDFISIQQPALFTVDVEEFAFINQGEEYQFDVQINVPLDEVAEITWNPAYDLSCTDCLDPLASPQQSTVYHVTVMTKDGCEDDASLLLEVEEKADVYIPNAFNPFSDNVDNNVFMVFTDENKDLNVKSLLVFSRWGEKVFEYYDFPPNDRQYGWNGKHRGEFMNPAVFVWIAEIEFEDGRVELFQGDVNLVH